MKNPAKISVILTFLAISFAFSCGQKSEPGKTAAPANSPDIQIYKSVGVVKAIDADAVKITIAHEDIPGYMPSMETPFGVGDARMIETVKPGDKVEFDLERSASNVVITKLNKIGEVANGGEIYKTNCAECHGGLGEGAPKGISLLKGHALKHSETEYAAQVTNGEGKKMPAFKDKLSVEQIAAVVKFVREELQKDVSKEEPMKH
jgi:mono/diheme cytochrome c family protein